MAEATELKREFYCGRVDEALEGRTITVYGWVAGIREFGGLTFIDLRDREGLLQVVINETFPHPEIVKQIGKEYVLAVGGRIARREKPNPELFSGRVELIAATVEVISQAALPPFFPDQRSAVSEELRFKYRYVDLRSQHMQRNFRLRSDVNLKIRNYLDQCGFLDIETPVLSKSTPEGARDYLVPSRIHRGKMFALPQSPQQYKQLLMMSGFERYFQIVRCFRDEDLRADRQPEFTQVDIEMSFAAPEELFAIIEGLVREVFAMKGFTVSTPFRRMPYRQAMEEYGSDKPDLRIPYLIRDFSAAVRPWQSAVLNSILESGGSVRGLVIPDGASFSRKNLDEINETIKSQGGKGVVWVRKTEQGFKSSLKADEAVLAAFFRENAIDETAIVFLVGDRTDKALTLCGRLREHLGKSFQDKNRLEFLWVTDFPLFFFNEEEDRLDSNHHPFTSPRHEDLPLLDSDPLQVRAIAYDLVLNGIEIGGGSQRIHDNQLQHKIFRLLKHSDEDIKDKFGFFIQALQFGTPPHLGIALGLDRLLMLLCGEESIREVIAFPKTTSSLCLLTGSPSGVSRRQLDVLGIPIR